jgi:hypothetical protein
VRPVERIPLCRSGADPKSRPAWTGGQQRLFDSGGQSPLHRYLSPRFSHGPRGATSLRQSRDAAAFARAVLCPITFSWRRSGLYL